MFMHNIFKDNDHHKCPQFSRREFMQRAGAAFGSAGLISTGLIGTFTGCKVFKAGSGYALSPDLSSATIIPTTCEVCVNKCSVLAKVLDGKVVKLDGNNLSPKSKGHLCARGQAAIKITYDPNRLKYPLIREGKRSEGRFRRATWDEAFDYAAKNLDMIRKKHSPHAVLFSSSEGYAEHIFRDFRQAFGSVNSWRHPTSCNTSTSVGFFNTYGMETFPDVQNTSYLIMAGANRLESIFTPDTETIIDALSNKAKMIYIDPRYTLTASKADEWLPIRPGTDLAFVLAMINTIIEKDVVCREFVANYCHGFDELKTFIKPYTPKWAESECDIPAPNIERIALEFAAAAPRAIFYPGRRSAWDQNQVQLRRAMAIVNAIVGNWDVPGGLLPEKSISLGYYLLPPYPWSETERIDNVAKDFPLNAIEDGVQAVMRERVIEGKPYPIKGWMIYKQDPLYLMPDRKRTLEMASKLDFICVIDILPSDVAWECADVILPEATYLERTDPLHVEKGIVPAVLYRQKAIEPMYESKPVLDIVKGLCERLELSRFFPYTIDEYNRKLVKPLGITLEQIAKTGVFVKEGYPKYGEMCKLSTRMRTATGKIELYSTRFEKYGYNPLPEYIPPKRAGNGNFVLITGHVAYFTGAGTQNNEWLLNIYKKDNLVWMNKDVADEMGLEDNQEVLLTSSIGSFPSKVHITKFIRKDCVFMLHGFGHTSPKMKRAEGLGICDSSLIENRWESITGSWCQNETFVTIKKA